MDVPEDLPDGIELIDVEEALKFADFKMPNPQLASEVEERALLKQSMTRIWKSSGDLVSINDSALRTAAKGSSPADLWMLLLVRMITRANSPEEQTSDGNDNETSLELNVANSPQRHNEIRETLFNYIVDNFPSRSVFTQSTITPS